MKLVPLGDKIVLKQFFSLYNLYINFSFLMCF